MGKRGPKPKPNPLRIATGAKVRNHFDPKPDPTPPKCPTWLDPAAKTKWRELVPELSRLGLLTSVDGDVLASYCQAWAEFRQATETLRAEGRYITVGGTPVEVPQPVGENGVQPPPVVVLMGGQRQPHPAVAQQRSAWKAVKDFAALFGLDPSSRSRIVVAPQEEAEDDPLGEFVRPHRPGQGA